MKNIKLTTNITNLDSYIYSYVTTTPLSNPKLISYSKDLAYELGIDDKQINSKEFTQMVNGQYLPNGGKFFAYAYAGHQFGYFVPQLGDGRAINLGKLKDYNLQLKGAGTTPYSRNGDGRAVLRSSIREYLLSEAMYGLNIPTTRALAIINSTSTAYREDTEPCSVVLRASKSWIRFGSFEFAYNQKDNKEKLIQLANEAINESYPHLKNKKNKYDEFYCQIVDKTIDLIVNWQCVGFCHGVINTDNMSIAGLTIDYGPFAFQEEFKKDFICNKSDYEGRYSFSNQPFIAQWNLNTLAQVLSPIINYDLCISYNDTFIGKFKEKYFNKMALKLGFIDINEDDIDLILELFLVLESSCIDYTAFFYFLSCAKYDDIINMASYKDDIEIFLDKYKIRVKNQNLSLFKRLENMRKINPKFILKNYIIQEIIQNCENGNFKMLNDFLNIVHNPYDEHKEFEKYSLATPKDKVEFTLSCSS